MADTLKLDQYDDDLTIGLDDFNEDLYVDEDDLLRFQPPESPLANLQSIVVSIDWEISDEILLQFNEEILALREIWADEKIYLVYLQALEQISKYIYQEKVDVHPSAVKLLPLFFQNLEKISSPDFVDEEEKQALLVADVKRFNFLKKEISSLKETKVTPRSGDGTIALQNLKALVLGLDWEVTEEELDKLRREVMYLENLYSASKPRLILLQGIGTLAVYIQHKSGNADAGAFRLLHDFFATLERLATSSLSAAEEKEALFVEVEKFNFFKAKIAGTLSPEAIERDERERAKETDYPSASAVIVPAFSDVDPAKSVGFQEDVAAEELGDTEELTSKISTFFPDEGEDPSQAEEKEEEELGDVSVEAASRLDDFFGDEMTEYEQTSDRDLALQGVAVEIEGDDDSDEEDEPLLSVEDSPAFIADEKDPVEQVFPGVESETESRLDDFFGAMEETEPENVDKSFALQGVNVETDADDESEETALTRLGDEPAPALGADNEVLLEEDIESRLNSFFSDDVEIDPVEQPSLEVESETESRLDDFFGAMEEAEPENIDKSFALQGVNVETDADDESEEAALSQLGDAPAPALVAENEILLEEDIESRLDSFFSDDVEIDPRTTPVGDEVVPALESPGSSDPSSTQNNELLGEDDIEATLDSFFEDFGDDPVHSDATESIPDEEKTLDAESIAPALSFIDDTVAPGLSAHVEQGVEESEEEDLLSAGLEDTLDAFFTGKDDVEFSDTPEEELFGDDFFAVEENLPVAEGELFEGTTEDETDSGDDSAVADLVGAVAVGGAAALLTADSQVKSAEDEADVDDLVDSFSDDEEEVVAAIAPVTESVEIIFEEVSEDTPEDYGVTEDVAQVEIEERDSAPLETVLKAENDSDPVLDIVQDTDMYLFADIRGSISSLSFDLSETVVEGVLSDINALRQKFSGDPIAKSFLQLMSTLSQHIRRYQYEASSEAFTLLMDVHETMESTIVSDLSERQNSLLAETYKVLQWQQDIIDTQQVSTAPSEREESVEQVIDENELFSEGEDELIYAVHEEELATSKEHDVDVLRGELQELRETLQDELACLRRDLIQQ